METFFECHPCCLRQALRVAQLSNADETQQHMVLQRTLSLLQSIPMNATPPEIAYQVHRIVHDVVDPTNPYHEAKKISTKQALDLYPRLKTLVHQSKDPLACAIRLSIAGNIIDFAMNDQIDNLWGTVERVLQQPYALDDSELLRARLTNVKRVLFLSDNAGETVFDRVLIEELPVPVTYAVKGDPFLNDAIMEDALAAGLDSCATLISNGVQGPVPGTILSLCSAEFREHFADAPLIIAKGQANFETLGEAGEKIFCLLQVKCPVISGVLDTPVGSIVIRQSVCRKTACQ